MQTAWQPCADAVLTPNASGSSTCPELVASISSVFYLCERNLGYREKRSRRFLLLVAMPNLAEFRRLSAGPVSPQLSAARLSQAAGGRGYNWAPFLDRQTAKRMETVR